MPCFVIKLADEFDEIVGIAGILTDTCKDLRICLLWSLLWGVCDGALMGALMSARLSGWRFLSLRCWKGMLRLLLCWVWCSLGWVC